jgi:hypothetical protein
MEVIMKNITKLLIIIGWFCFLSGFSSAQSNEQLVGTHYQLANVSVKSYVAVSKKSYVVVSNECYVKVSKVQHVGISRREFVKVSSENYVTNPMRIRGY